MQLTGMERARLILQIIGTVASAAIVTTAAATITGQTGPHTGVSMQATAAKRLTGKAYRPSSLKSHEKLPPSHPSSRCHQACLRWQAANLPGGLPKGVVGGCSPPLGAFI